MTYCKISLKAVTKTAKYPDYRDTAFRSLFGSLRVNPTLRLTRSAFKQESVRYTTGLSISGVQQKLSLAVADNDELEPVTQGGQYILKPSPEEYPHAAENEHAAMSISKLLDIRTADCGLVSFADGELVYITRRFDRNDDGSKIHQEDLLQGFDMPSDSKYEKSYEEAGALISEMTGGKQAIVLDFLHRIVHAYLIGNDDMHLKNTSLQKSPENTTRLYDRLTPNYDCLFLSIFEHRTSTDFLALDLLADGFSSQFEHYGFYTGHDFIELASRLKIPSKPIQSFIKKIACKKASILETIDRSYMPDSAKAKAKALIDDRVRALMTGV